MTNKNTTLIDKFTTLLDKCDSDEIMVNSINVYKTNVYNLYFIRKEQFRLRDEDAAISELVFTDDLEKLIESAKNELLNRYLVKDLQLNK